LFGALGRADLFNPDEPREAEIAREMWASGDLVVPRLNGEPFLEKPPLFYWLVAASYRLAGGPGELPARAVPALAGLLCVLLTFGLGRELVGERGALLAAIVLLTSFQFLWTARRCMIDLPLTLMVLLACFALRRGVAGDGRARLRWLILGYLAVGAAILLKGIVGAGIPALVIAGDFAARADWRGLRRCAPIPGTILALLPSGLWTALLYSRLGGEGVREVVWVNNVLRFTGGAQKGHVQPFYYYLPSLLTDLAPWSLVLPFAVAAAWAATRRRDDGHTRLVYLLCWLLVPLVVLSIASTKRGIYLLPLYPAAALLVGWWLDRVSPARGAPAIRDRPVRIALGLLLGAGIVIAALLPASLGVLEPEGRVATALGLVLVAALALAGYAALRTGRADRLAILVAGAVGLVHLVAAGGIVPELVDRHASPREAARQIRRMADAGDRLALYDFKEGSLGGYLFYAGMTLPHLRTPEDLRIHLSTGGEARSPRSLALMREEIYHGVAPALGIATTIVRRFPAGWTVEVAFPGNGSPPVVLRDSDPIVLVAAGSDPVRSATAPAIVGPRSSAPPTAAPVTPEPAPASRPSPPQGGVPSSPTS